MNLTTNQIKKLVEKYPYLAPHNSWTGEIVQDYDYSYTQAWSIPEGWHKLFFLLCKELRPHLEKANLLDKFYFTQLKEKYGTMRVYTSALPNSVGHMIDLYESYSEYICQRCGELAWHETRGWISYLCHDCVNEEDIYCNIQHKKVMTLECYDSKRKHYKINISYRPLWKKYKDIKNLTDQEFLDYILN